MENDLEINVNIMTEYKQYDITKMEIKIDGLVSNICDKIQQWNGVIKDQNVINCFISTHIGRVCLKI